jgi:enoyl-CoA hydratase/carnithine racemase
MTRRPQPMEATAETIDTVVYEQRDRIAFVTLNRPAAKNALDPPMHDALCRVWEDFRDDDDVDVAILTGAGDSFCAGADLRTYVPANYVDARPSRVREIVDLGFGGLTRGLHTIRKPVIAAINGWALAGGLELALACDLRIASDRAIFGSFEARRGFHHGDGGITRLVNTCGVGTAMQLVLTAEPIDATRAWQCNLVMSVVPHDELLEQAELVARQILRNSQRAVRSAKEAILEVIGKPLHDQLRIEGWNSYTCVDRDEAAVLLQRFHDKADAGRAGSKPTGL